MIGKGMSRRHSLPESLDQPKEFDAGTAVATLSSPEEILQICITSDMLGSLG